MAVGFSVGQQALSLLRVRVRLSEEPEEQQRSEAS